MYLASVPQAPAQQAEGANQARAQSALHDRLRNACQAGEGCAQLGYRPLARAPDLRPRGADRQPANPRTCRPSPTGSTSPWAPGRVWCSQVRLVAWLRRQVRLVSADHVCHPAPGQLVANTRDWLARSVTENARAITQAPQVKARILPAGAAAMSLSAASKEDEASPQPGIGQHQERGVCAARTSRSERTTCTASSGKPAGTRSPATRSCPCEAADWAASAAADARPGSPNAGDPAVAAVAGAPAPSVPGPPS